MELVVSVLHSFIQRDHMHTSFSNLCFSNKNNFCFFFFKQDLARNCDLTDVKLSWAQLWHTFMISMLGR